MNQVSHILGQCVLDLNKDSRAQEPSPSLEAKSAPFPEEPKAKTSHRNFRTAIASNAQDYVRVLLKVGYPGA